MSARAIQKLKWNDPRIREFAPVGAAPLSLRDGSLLLYRSEEEYEGYMATLGSGNGNNKDGKENGGNKHQSRGRNRGARKPWQNGNTPWQNENMPRIPNIYFPLMFVNGCPDIRCGAAAP